MMNSRFDPALIGPGNLNRRPDIMIDLVSRIQDESKGKPNLKHLGREGFNMTITLVATPDPEPFNMRTCPIWAIPQLAELRRRVSTDKENPAKLVMFEAEGYKSGIFTGRFVIDIPNEARYFGFINSGDMNEFRMPALLEGS